MAQATAQDQGDRMTTNTARTLLTAALAAATLTLGMTVHADDTELLAGPTVTPPTNRPNILFVLDTSGSMDSPVTGVYDPAVTYAGACTDDKIYWREGTGDAPACTTSQWVYRNAFKCNSAMADLNAQGRTSGTLRSVQWRIRAPGNPNRWDRITNTLHDDPNWVECRNDRGVHGNGVDASRLYPADNTATSGSGSTRGPWNSSSSASIWNSDTSRNGSSYLFYTANYLNWYYGPTGVSTRIAVMKTVLNQVLDGLDGVNAGLMRYSNNRGESGDPYDERARGGMVVNQMQPIETNRAAMKGSINSWNAWGMTPLSETLYEATQYLRGGAVVFGNSSRFSPNSGDAFPSVAASRQAGNSNLYDSPMDLNCQKTYIVFLTDGLPTSDNEADADIQALTGATCSGTGNGRCLEELSGYLFSSDLRADVAGQQNVTSYWIGFGDISSGATLLESTATAGGGQFYGAADTPQLIDALTAIIASISNDSTSFTAPTVAVNAFNRTQNLNDLYISVFRPGSAYRWLGNFKKYRIRPDGVIIDSNNVPAVESATGFFSQNAQSFWSTVIDGREAEKGGAASKLTDPATRTIYSNLTAESGVLSEELSELKDSSNLLLANTLLLEVASSTAVAGRPTPEDLVDWAYGYDRYDANADGTYTDVRADMGDPLHSRPGAVIYGGPANNPDLTLYATTNDGVLHAIDAQADLNNTTVGGTERWAFMPRELLPRIEKLIDETAVASRGYGLDSSVEVLRLDRNGNGTIEPNGTDIDGSGGPPEDDEKDRVYLFFGMRRGGSHYYAIDVTDRDAPRLMWRIGENDAHIAVTDPEFLPGVGQTWSAPTIARVNVSGHSFTDNPDKFVLIFGGGYDTTQDQIPYQVDGVGNRVYVVDAISGELLWRAGPTTDTGAELKLAKMTNSIPGEVRAVDLTGDGFADRMYASDLGGRIWRFDIFNGQAPSSLVTGGVFASLGVGDSATKPDASNRRFFYAPDVALLKNGSQNWINVAIGSGPREKPVTDTTVVNRFYSLRDYNVFTPLTSAQYKSSCVSETPPCHQIITDADPVDVTTDVNATIPASGPGWKLTLVRNGEKALAESRTFQNKVYFTTFVPTQVSTDPAACSTRFGINRLYIVDAATADPVENFDTTVAGATEASDRSKELAQRGTIAPEAIFVFPTPDADSNNPNPPAVPPICLVGLETCGTGLLNPPVRTYWQQRGTN
jgi:type IV pilus assembly protein PilY1